MKFCFSALALLFLFACNSNNVETKQKIEKKKPVKTVQKEITWEDDEKRMKAELEKSREEFKTNMQKKGFVFSCFDQCGGGDGVGVGAKEIKKYGIRKLYDVEKIDKKDSTRIKFKFISSCCLEHIGDAEKAGDTLKLSYKNISYAPCDCRCIYYYQYDLPKEKFNSKYILLGDSLLNFRK